MPKNQLTEEEKYKTKVRKSFKFVPSVDSEKVIDLMWDREDEKRLKQIEESLGKPLGLKKKEIKPFKSVEEVFPYHWRDVHPPSGKPRTRSLPGKKVKLGWI